MDSAGTDKNWKSSEYELKNPNHDRINKIANSFYSGQYNVDEMYELTKIDKWYLKKMWKIIELQKELEGIKLMNLNQQTSLSRAKRIDSRITKSVEC